MNAFGTHLPILKRLFKEVEIESVLEFGMGAFSTDFFIVMCKNLLSIEQQSGAYFKKIEQSTAKNKKVKCLFIPGIKDSIEFLEDMKDKFDLIMVDGEQVSRPHLINAAFKKTAIIVAHDTDSNSYRWDKVEIPKGWTKIEFKENSPFTTVWTKDKKLIEALNKKEG